MSAIKLYIFSVLFLIFGPVMAQEELGELPFRPEQQSQNAIQSSRAGANDNEIIYLYDTLNLPVIDDFTKYRLKIFPVSLDDPAVFDSASFKFTVDGQSPDSLEYRFEPAYNIILNPFTGKLDSSKADSMLVNYYGDSIREFFLTDQFYVHRNYHLFTQNGITRKIDITPDTIIYNLRKAHYFARDDNYSYWISRGAFWNRTMAVDPPTLGIITFDGLDSNGNPYDNSSKLTFGKADEFESKPINLYGKKISGQTIRYGSSDSIYLSFFYQAQGYGDRPEKVDSLTLDFFSPITKQWSTIWSNELDSLAPFKQVFFHIKDTIYLQKGFKFRFKNYATLSGNFDHWHIDYIHLDEKRELFDEIEDFAISKPIRTTIKNYTSMPWEHYKTNPWEFTGDTINLHMRNLSKKPDIAEARYKVYRAAEFNSTFVSSLQQYPNVPINGEYKIPMTLKGGSNNFTFPLDDHERQWFRVVSQTFSSNDQFRENDTLVHIQIFDRYYSYDDYSAEKTYHLNLVGTNLAVEFETPVSDTLRGILINFVETFEPVSFHKIKLKVYKTLGSSAIYESGPIDVVKTSAGRFHRYVLPEDIIVDGKFYIGWEQYDQNKTYVGYDVNYNNQDKTFVSEVPGRWSKSIYQGTIMIRADFGNGKEEPLESETIIPSTSDVKLYPNPASNMLNISTDKTIISIDIYDTKGRLVLNETTGSSTIQIDQLEVGLYIVRVSDESGSTSTKKLMISR